MSPRCARALLRSSLTPAVLEQQVIVLGLSVSARVGPLLYFFAFRCTMFPDRCCCRLPLCRLARWRGQAASRIGVAIESNARVCDLRCSTPARLAQAPAKSSRDPAKPRRSPARSSRARRNSLHSRQLDVRASSLVRSEPALAPAERDSSRLRQRDAELER